MTNRRLLAAVGAICLVLASCSTHAPGAAPSSSTNARPTQTSETTSTGEVPAVPGTVTLEKGWRQYAETVYYGCPEDFATGADVLDKITPKVFDVKTGKFISPAIPTAAPGENITGGVCALSGTADAIKVTYLMTTTKPANGLNPEVNKVTSYVFDMTSQQPLATKEQQPPTPDLIFSGPPNWKLAPTSSGAAWIYPYTNAHIATASARTVILSNTDGSQTWSDPAAGTAWPDVLVFQRDTTGARYYGAELRLPTTGESIHQDNDIWTVDAVLTDGQDQLATFTYWDSYSPAIVSTRFFDLQTRSTIKIGDSDRISGGGVRASLSDGRLFINAMGSDNSDFGGFGVWNLRTQQWDVLRNREEADKLKIASLAYYGAHLYVTNDADTYTVLNLPSTDPVATNWSVRPYARMSGWTLVCRGENTNSSHDCETVALVRDEDGHYPGPWT